MVLSDFREKVASGFTPRKCNEGSRKETKRYVPIGGCTALAENGNSGAWRKTLMLKEECKRKFTRRNLERERDKEKKISDSIVCCIIIKSISFSSNKTNLSSKDNVRKISPSLYFIYLYFVTSYFKDCGF